MKKNFLISSIVLLFSIYCLLFTTFSYACIGARALSMGGAFIGVADDASTTYWNPAALAKIKQLSTTYMRIMNNRLEVNYSDYAALILPISQSTTVGISYILIEHRMGYIILVDEQDNILAIDTLIYNDKLYFVSYGTKIRKNTYLGFNLRETNKQFYCANIDCSTDIVFAYSFDISLFKEFSKELSLGMLIQDVNKPKSRVGRLMIIHPRNYRAGIAYKPIKGVTIAYDLYDIFPEKGAKTGYRIGVEVQPTNNFAIRAGSYGDTFTTVGVGYKDSKRKLEIDWCFLHARIIRKKLKDATHIVSVTKMF